VQSALTLFPVGLIKRFAGRTSEKSLKWRDLTSKEARLKHMVKTDAIKEKIGHLKLWPGILAITDISLLGWLLSRIEDAIDIKRSGAILLIIVITGMVFLIYKQIEILINKLEESKND